MSSFTPRTAQPGSPRAVQYPDREREFAFDQADFDALRDLIQEQRRPSVSRTRKWNTVYGRISRRLRHLKLRTLADLPPDARVGRTESIEFCDAMTTNLTSFFRESHHFDYLRDHVLRPKLGQPEASRRIRIWSAACSSGEEPYSIAMTVHERSRISSAGTSGFWRPTSTRKFWRRRAAAWYPAERLEALGERRFREHFQPLAGIPGITRSRPTSRRSSPSNDSTWFSRCR